MPAPWSMVHADRFRRETKAHSSISRNRASQLRLASIDGFPEMACQPFLERIHINVKNRREVQRNELRKKQPAYYHQPKRTPRISADAATEGNRRGSHQRGHGGHH